MKYAELSCANLHSQQIWIAATAAWHATKQNGLWSDKLNKDPVHKNFTIFPYFRNRPYFCLSGYSLDDYTGLCLAKREKLTFEVAPQYSKW